MKRREFITLIGVVAATWPITASAQQSERMRRVGVLFPAERGDAEFQSRDKALRRELEKLGWQEERNVRFDFRWSGPDPNRMRSDAAELIALAPDVIVTASNIATTITGSLTRTIPIVFSGGDPLGSGLVTNMASPGGNVTGFATYESALAEKWLQLLKEIAPHITRVAAIRTADGAAGLSLLRSVEARAASFGVQLTSLSVRDAAEVERGVDQFFHEPNAGLIVMPGPASTGNRALIVALAATHQVPAIFPDRNYVAIGGLMSYGSIASELYRNVASYVDRILKGEKPGNLPVQAPTKYEFIVNLRTAKALGLTVPTSIQLLADEVVE
jgi:putative ABC transport system substrate-binding protein